MLNAPVSRCGRKVQVVEHLHADGQDDVQRATRTAAPKLQRVSSRRQGSAERGGAETPRAFDHFPARGRRFDDERGRSRRPDQADGTAGQAADSRHQRPGDDRHDGGCARDDQEEDAPAWAGGPRGAARSRCVLRRRRSPRARCRLCGRAPRGLRGRRDLRLCRKRVERIGDRSARLRDAFGRRGRFSECVVGHDGPDSAGPVPETTSMMASGTLSSAPALSLPLTSSAPPPSPPSPCARPW